MLPQSAREIFLVSCFRYLIPFDYINVMPQNPED
jgi:hypothetical protein